MNSSTIGISGYDLVRKVISARQDDAIYTLIASTGGSECDYLEFKASIVTRDLEPGESPSDIYWNIARELIAMANTRGGILIIGIDDSPAHNVVPLRDSDPNGIIAHEGLEAYMRKVIDSHVLPENQEWTYKKCRYKLAQNVNLSDYVQIEKMKFRDEDVIAYLVSPCEEGKFLSVRKTYHDGRTAPEELPRRLKGQIGECETLTELDNIIDHIKTREVTDLLLTSTLERLVKMDVGFAIDTLPPRNAGFCGREEELNKIAQFIDDKRIPVLHGEGGTGKTELACEFAHRHKGRFGGGCLFLDMRNVSSWSTALNALYADPKIRQAIGPVPQDMANGSDSERSRSSWIFNRIISNLSRGNMLVILDNLNDDLFLTYNELKHGYLSDYLDGDHRVCMIATTRIAKHILPGDKNEIAQLLEIGNLSPDDAVKLLCAKLPKDLVSTEKDKGILKEIVQRLGHHAWRTEIAGGYLNRNYSQLVKPPLETFLRTILKTGADIGHEGRTWRGNGITVADLLKPTIDSLSGKEGETGKRALEVAKCIAVFPVEGVIEPPLRHLWKTVLNFNEADGGIDEFSSSMKLLEQYALIGPHRDGERVRMHQLTQEFFRQQQTRRFKNQQKFRDAISKALANDPKCPLRYWAQLAKDGLLMAHCPWNRLDGSTCHDILVHQKEFASKVTCWEKFDGYEAAEILSIDPTLTKRFRSLEILYHDDSESPCKAFALLIAKHPEFAEKCDFSRLNCKDIVYILKNQPQLVEKCIPAIKNFQRREWAALLFVQPNVFKYRPDLEQYCQWDEFHPSDWVRVIARQPSYADREVFTHSYSLSRFSMFKWAYLLAHNPNAFIKHPDCPKDKIAENVRATVMILSKQPQLFKAREPDGTPLLPFSLKSLSPALWINLLIAQPQFAEECRAWNAFSGRDWARLLVSQPQFATRCDFRKLDGNDWGALLEYQPQLANSDSWNLMVNEPHEEFFSPIIRVLYNHPELGERPDLNLSNLSQQGKRLLLSRIPSLENRGLIDSSSLPIQEWARLIAVTPLEPFVRKCPFKDMNALEIAIILHEQPQLSADIRNQVPEGVLETANEIISDSLRILMINDLFWHLDDARMSCNLTKLIVVAANISWIYFVLGLYRPSRRYLELLKLCIRKSGNDIPTNAEYPISDLKDVLPSLETMIDTSEGTALPIWIPEMPERKIFIFIRRFRKSSRASALVKNLKAAISKRKLGRSIILEDAFDFASSKMLKRIKNLKESNERVALFNIEERLAHFFTSPKEKAQVAEFRKNARFFNPASKDNLQFDRVVTVSPMLFGKLALDAGSRVLSAICADESSRR